MVRADSRPYIKLYHQHFTRTGNIRNHIDLEWYILFDQVGGTVSRSITRK